MNMEEQNPAAIKVLFLDMDGVLTRGATMQSRTLPLRLPVVESGRPV